MMMKGSPAAGHHAVSARSIRPTNQPAFSLFARTSKSSSRQRHCATAGELSAENEKNIQVHFSLGVLLASEKQYKAAQWEMEKADALQPGTFEILYNLGEDMLRSGDNSGAEAVLQRALRAKPDSAETLYLMAQVYANQSRPLDALDLLVRAHKLAPAECRHSLSDGAGQHVAELL